LRDRRVTSLSSSHAAPHPPSPLPSPPSAFASSRLCYSAPPVPPDTSSPSRTTTCPKNYSITRARCRHRLKTLTSTKVPPRTPLVAPPPPSTSLPTLKSDFSTMKESDQGGPGRTALLRDDHTVEFPNLKRLVTSSGDLVGC
jgi:hypothetical protein